MKNKIQLMGLLAIMQLTSCATQPMSNDNSKKVGAGLGAAAGAALGGILGHQSGRGLEGAAIGAAAGGAYGYQHGPKPLGGDGTIQQTRRGN